MNDTIKTRDQFQDKLAELVNDAVDCGASAEEIATILILTAQDLQE